MSIGDNGSTFNDGITGYFTSLVEWKKQSQVQRRMYECSMARHGIV